jgi:CRISPR-associated protein Csm1
MSLQVFLYAQFRGIERFLAGAGSDASLASRALWVSLLTEVVPRSFLAARGLSPLLAGYSGGGSFLLLIGEPSVPEADAYLASIREAVHAATAGQLELHWSSTENLGSWPNVWSRLRDGLRRSRLAPLAPWGAAAFSSPLPDPGPEDAAPWHDLVSRLSSAATFGCSPENPLLFLPAAGEHQWSLDSLGVPLPSAAPRDLARKAQGRRTWGLLRCDIDHAGLRLQQADTAENFLYLAILYKGLVAGELQRIAALPQHAGRVAILFSGGDDFAITGAWDALLSVATEFHRVFSLFAADLPGGKDVPEGASLSAALSVAGPDDSLASLWRRNHATLEAVKSSGGNAFALFDRFLDWPALKEAESLKSRIRKLRENFQCPPAVFAELEEFYGARGAGDLLASVRSRRRERALQRPWRFQSRLRRLAGDRSGSEFDRQWRAFLGDLMGRGASPKQLRPAGKVALDWAQLESGWRARD